MEEGIRELLEEISPIKDLTGNKMELEFLGYEIREPHYSQEECVERDLTYTAPLYVKVRLLIKTTGEIKEPANVFFGDFPLMTDKGTFIINGTERVAVSQLMRSPGSTSPLKKTLLPGASSALPASYQPMGPGLTSKQVPTMLYQSK